MMNNINRKIVASEMLDAARIAIEHYALTIRGAHLCGQTSVKRVGDTLEVKCHIGELGADYFTVRVVRAQ